MLFISASTGKILDSIGFQVCSAFAKNWLFYCTVYCAVSLSPSLSQHMYIYFFSSPSHALSTKFVSLSCFCSCSCSRSRPVSSVCLSACLSLSHAPALAPTLSRLFVCHSYLLLFLLINQYFKLQYVSLQKYYCNPIKPMFKARLQLQGCKCLKRVP